ncbi:MAG TPA: NAD(P)-dependent oxidoreductase [Anaeromyxobacteraceae bacterium]|nr:NAD(P)-dependent oxidoreductase [Anaeromyxobacteraceae bacterium]
MDGVSRVALVTGSAGGRAQAIEAELAAAGWQVRRLAFDGLELPDLISAARGVQAIFHVGVRTSRADGARRRADAEAAAAFAAGRAALEGGARRYVLVSTTSVYGRPRNLPCQEGDLKAPRTPAERARWRAEQAAWLAFRQGAPLTVLRPTLIYGPNLKSGAIRALALITLLNQGRRRIPILRRGPVTHLLHVRDLARACLHVAEYPDDEAVVGRAFNVGDDAPLPLAEHLAAALAAMGYRAGRILPYSPRLTACLLWLVRHVPDRILVDPINRRLSAAWERLTHKSGSSTELAPRLDRESLHWMSADHYYDTRRLADLGYRPLFPISASGLPETIHALLSSRLLPPLALPHPSGASAG